MRKKGTYTLLWLVQYTDRDHIRIIRTANQNWGIPWRPPLRIYQIYYTSRAHISIIALKRVSCGKNRIYIWSEFVYEEVLDV